MKIQLIVIGKTKQTFVREGLSFYMERLKHYAPFELVELPEVSGRALTPAQQSEEEAKRILERLPNGAFLVLLDERGKALRSVEFAEYLAKRQNAATQALVFAVGGPYGHGRALRERADFALTLSAMTFPHDLVRLLFVEQLYRAFSILRREPYHHE